MNAVGGDLDDSSDRFKIMMMFISLAVLNILIFYSLM